MSSGRPVVGTKHIQESHDEVDLAHVLRFLWAGRWRISAIMFMSALIVLVGNGISFLRPDAKQIHSATVQFTFPNADSGKYPSGKPFSVSDIASGDILGAVHTMFDLDAHGITNAEFAAAVSVQPYSITEDFIGKRYKEKLGQKDLASTEVEALESAYRQDLQQNARRFAKISLSLDRNTSLTPSLVAEILNAIPRHWSETSIRNRGVLEVVALSAAGLLTDGLQDAEYTIALQRLKEYGGHMREGLRSMIADSRLKVIRDQGTGMLPRDLEVRLEEFLQYRVTPLQMEIMEQGYVRNRALAELYFRSKLQDLVDDRAELMRKAEIYSDAMRSLNGNRESSAGAAENREIAPLVANAEYVDRMLEIGGRLSESDFRHELLEKRLGFLTAVEERTTAIGELERQLQLLRNVNVVQDFQRADVNGRLSGIVAEFEQLKNIYAGLSTSANNAMLGDTGQLYRMLSSAPSVHDPYAVNMKRLAMSLLVALLIGAFLGMALHLLIAAIRSESAAPATPSTEQEERGTVKPGSFATMQRT